MEFNPVDFYDLGLILNENPIENKLEASYRTAISRIYYAIFLIIRRELYRDHKNDVENNDISEDSGMHQKIINFLLYKKGGKENKIGQFLQNLKKLREDADYELLNNVNETDIIDAKRFYKKIIFELKKLDWVYRCE